MSEQHHGLTGFDQIAVASIQPGVVICACISVNS